MKDASGKIEHRNQNSNLGGTMRLGGQKCLIKKSSLSHKLYKKLTITERHRHRYEFNNEYKELGVEIYLACREHSVIRKKAQENNIKVILGYQKQSERLDLFIKVYKNFKKCKKDNWKRDWSVIKKCKNFSCLAFGKIK